MRSNLFVNAIVLNRTIISMRVKQFKQCIYLFMTLKYVTTESQR